MNITRDELKAAIDAAHARGVKVTGHLCSVTYKEAAELGIDDLEHGFFVNTQLDPDKKPDVSSSSAGSETLAKMTADSPEAKDLINTLVSHHVAVTSTLAVFESEAGPGRPPARQQVLDALTVEARNDYFLVRQRLPNAPTPKIDPAVLWQHDLALEHAFVPPADCSCPAPIPQGAAMSSPLRRPARHRASGRSRIFTSRGNPDRHLEWCHLSRTG